MGSILPVAKAKGQNQFALTRALTLPSRFRSLRRAILIGGAFLFAAPFILILPLNFIHPPTTAMMLWRTAERLLSGKRPIYPRRVVMPHNRISSNLHRAVLAAEDERFFVHEGFDFTEIEKAIERRRRGGRLRGASTISQQTAKNLFLWEGRSFVRKGLEVYLTLVLELCLPKERILDLYLNLAEWGNGVFGAEVASRTYYRKSARNLTRDEAARLAAILPSPLRWSPNGMVARRRADIILQRMGYAVPREEPFWRR
jgi:monofunctional biosynthetic peptidoglycan transglycosylase